MPSRLRSTRSGKISPGLAGGLRRLGERVYARRRLILWTGVAASLVALLGARRIQVDADFLYYFEPDSEVRRANEAINREIVGSNPFYIVVDAGEAGAIKRWDVLRHIKDLQNFVQTLPGVTSSVSLVDYLEILEAGMGSQGQGDLVIDAAGDIVPAEIPKPFWQDPANLKPVLAVVEARP